MARKIQPRSKVPKPKKGQSSEEYWRERESRQRAINIRDEARTAERINEIFQSMQDSIQQEIESFYQRYADDEGITLTEARGRVSRIDMEQYERLAKKYVKLAHAHGSIKDMAFTDEANDQMRLYNLTMKVNRLEMLKARCGIRAMEGYRDTERLINENLEERAYSEYRRLAGILGNSVQFNENMVRAIVNASYQNATWSQRLWSHQASLSSQIGTQLASGILAGKSSTVLAREIQKLTGGSTYACQRLMRTELRRVQTAAAEQSMLDNGVTEYKFMVANGVNPCDECVALDGQVFKISEMEIGKNAPPKHPSCHCCTCPAIDEEKWQRWLDGPAQAGVPWAEFEGDSDAENHEIYSGFPKSWETKADMSDHEALKGTNPHYAKTIPAYLEGTKEDYTNNCTNCVVAYAARKQKQLVTACSVGECGKLRNRDKLFDAWMGREYTTTEGSGLNDILAYMESCDENVLVVITIQRPSSIFRQVPGHAFAAEKRNGRVVFVDPQIGKVYNDYSIFDDVSYGKTRFMRVDDLELSDLGKSACKRVSI